MPTNLDKVKYRDNQGNLQYLNNMSVFCFEFWIGKDTQDSTVNYGLTGTFYCHLPSDTNTSSAMVHQAIQARGEYVPAWGKIVRKGVTYAVDYIHAFYYNDDSDQDYMSVHGNFVGTTKESSMPNEMSWPMRLTGGSLPDDYEWGLTITKL